MPSSKSTLLILIRGFKLLVVQIEFKSIKSRRIHRKHNTCCFHNECDALMDLYMEKHNLLNKSNAIIVVTNMLKFMEQLIP
jgi:hypothetical protein